MPIGVFANRSLGIRIHQIVGRSVVEEFLALADFYREHPHYAHLDLVNLVDENVDPRLTGKHLSRLREVFTDLQPKLRPPLVRRSAWVCPSVAAWPLLEAWLHGRHSRDAMRIEVCLGADLAQIACLFDETEMAAIREFAGFESLNYIEAAQHCGLREDSSPTLAVEVRPA